MYRIDDPSASTTLPTPEAALTEGYWTEGNPGSGIPATLERASWFNMVQEELRAIPVAAGIVPSKTVYNQILSALKSMFASVVGSARNLTMSVAAASASATLTADELIVETALGGQTYRLASFNKTINLATTGAGGMDTGTAPTSGFVAIYAIWNPTTQTAALLGTNAATLQPNVYGGANMPAGYTASALVSVWPTNPSKLLKPGFQRDRTVNFPSVGVLSTNTVVGTYTALSMSTAVPANAVGCIGLFSTSSTAGSALNGSIAGDSNGSAQQSVSSSGAISTGLSTTCNFQAQILTAQTLFYIFSSSAGTPTFFLSISAYQL
jgi:hypothetical protein